ncbi:hypothetical protein BC826DRAFT_1026319 [Russula brevipes]|nr:hypothetical protein BC826DRAFT_1026319 [Russula brevipes]
MEGMVCDDDLWTSLQVNLWNARQSDGPTPDQFRVFEDCCTVLDVAFSALEDSSKVDWRAPDFGLLAQNFESFITHYSQGAFMATTTMFRVNTVKARICKALVSQFRDDLDREGTLFFRSKWDTASLAMVLRILNIGYEEDAEIWRSHTNEGHASPEVTQTYLGIIDAAARDGPLLIFCKLGHLLTTAVPLYSSGLERKDLESVFELQRNIVEDQRHPLNRASEEVWGELVRLRDQVGNIYGRSTDKDRDDLRHLLEIIDDVRNSHPPAPGT